MNARGKDELRVAKRAVREPYAWPGGYPVFVLCADGELLCTNCVRTNWRQIVWATRWGGFLDSGWAVAGSVIHWEDEPGETTFCGHCGERLQSAYGEARCDREAETQFLDAVALEEVAPDVLATVEAENADAALEDERREADAENAAFLQAPHRIGRVN